MGFMLLAGREAIPMDDDKPIRILSVEDLYSEGTLKILHEAIILDEMMANRR